MKNGFVIFCYLVILSELCVAQLMSKSLIVRQRTFLCPSISLKNGITSRRNVRARRVRFSCNRGYSLAGQRYSNCIRNATWDPPPPKCVRPTCKPILQHISGENLLNYPTHSGAVQFFYCKSGYVLNGPKDIFCDGINWSNGVPRCLPTNTKPNLSCDFEDTDLCGWTHDLNHDFDWTRRNYNTPSGTIGTGPTFDHTKGVGKDGHYMYIESSSRAENDTARLVSPVYDKMDGEVCLEFYYHMFGATIGTLRAYMKTIKQPWILQPQNLVFSKTGNQGDRWYRSFQHLGKIDDEFQIIIEGVRGSGYVSDIAIDDVKIIINCTDKEKTTTIMESSTYNDLLQTVDSCENRCGLMETIDHDNYHLTCDCDEECFNNNRCCPDFNDLCSGTTATDDFDTTIASEEIMGETYTTTSTIKPILKHYTEVSNDRYFTTSTPEIVSKPKTTFMERNKTKPLKPTTNLKQTTKLFSLISTTQMTPNMFPNLTKPILYFNTPSPTPEIFRKVIVKPTPFVLIKKTTKISKEVEKIYDNLDVPKVNKVPEIDITTKTIKDLWPYEKENTIDTRYTGNFSETNKLFSQSYVDQANSHFLLVGIVATTVVSISIVLFIAQRYFRHFHCLRRMTSSNGESQSDVRYLTNADVLDFSLADSYSES